LFSLALIPSSAITDIQRKTIVSYWELARYRSAMALPVRVQGTTKTKDKTDKKAICLALVEIKPSPSLSENKN